MDESNLLPPNAVEGTNSRLLSDARLDDPAAWQKLTFLYGPVVRFWITRAGIKSKADIADISQEVFVAVAKNLKQFERDKGRAKFRSWLKVITVSKMNDHFRRCGRQPQAVGGSTAAMQFAELPEPDRQSVDLDTALSACHDPETEQTVLTQRVLESLRSEFRENTWKAFWRTAVDGRTATETADELDVTSAAVRKAKSRVLRRLRQVLADIEAG